MGAAFENTAMCLHLEVPKYLVSVYFFLGAEHI